MSIFQNRVTLTQNIAYMALMAAINIIFSVVSSFIPVIGYFLMLVLPLTSVIVTLFCKTKYYPIYFIATIGLCLVSTLWNISNTIYYVIPSILTGFLFGMLVKYKVNGMYIILLTSILQTILSMLLIPVIDFFLGIDLIIQFETIFSLQNSTSISNIVPSFVFFISLCQMIFTYIIIDEEINKFGFQIIEQKIVSVFLPLGTMFCLLIVFIFSFFALPVSYLFLMITIFLSVFMIVTSIQEKNKLIVVLDIVSFLITFVLFGVFYQMVDDNKGLLLISIFPTLVAFITIANNLLRLKTHKDRIETRGKK
jgi:hypothetical protein